MRVHAGTHFEWCGQACRAGGADAWGEHRSTVFTHLMAGGGHVNAYLARHIHLPASGPGTRTRVVLDTPATDLTELACFLVDLKAAIGSHIGRMLDGQQRADGRKAAGA